MVTLTIGIFPGKVDTYVVEEGITVKDALALAGLTQSAEQDIKVDGEVVNANYVISADDSMVLLAQRIKGAAR